MKKILLPLLILFSSPALAQISDSSIVVPMIYGFYSYQVPGGDMAERFGNSNAVGPGFQVKLRSNWVIGAEFNHIWRNKVKDGEEIIQHLLTNDGNIIARDGTYAVFDLFQRGYTITGHFGKIIPVLSPNPNSGLFVKFGFGYMQHWVRIQVHENTVPWLDGDYGKGYDRLTNGFTINQFIGYLFLGETRILNFYAGFEFTQAWTRNKRDINFDNRDKEDKQRLDLLYGIKIGWIIPINRRTPAKYYYY